MTHVKDAITNFSDGALTEFKDKQSVVGTIEYTYNANGAMRSDLNKGITEIQYNSLNLPRQMVISSAAHKAKNYYTYSASGVKLKTEQRYDPNHMVTPSNATNPTNDGLADYTNTDYVGNVIYEKSKKGVSITDKTRILVDGGYYEAGTYYYYLTDHLGNNRVVVNSSGTVTQRNHYYPFGTAFAEPSLAEQGKQPYRYNGKEFDHLHGLNLYDYSARYYESAVGRFTSVDPLAEKYYSISPYAYCANNPLKYIDPDGRAYANAADSTYAESVANDISNKINTYTNRHKELLNNFLNESNFEKRQALKKEMEESKENINNLKSGLKEMEEMLAASQIFTFNMIQGDIGQARFDGSIIVMDVAGNGLISNAVHEISHGYDMYKIGRIPDLYTTETKAYGRQFSYGGRSVMPASDWSSVNKLGDVTKGYVSGITDNGIYIYARQNAGGPANWSDRKNREWGDFIRRNRPR